ncbi:MAG TPA: ribonuclease H-like domain-containing protein [Armatimonadota bacterium]|nr:ribonuclease H-like domain-containing protein [Armatimonadota bacterium]
MLSRTFIHVAGIGPVTERRIWERGCHCWDDFLRDPTAAGLSAQKTERVAETVASSLDHLRSEDHRYFSETLAPREHWRAFPEFGHRIAYLDIETTGMSEQDAVTIIGVYDGRDVRVYTHGEDLQDFADDIGRYSLLVTFFGSCFDLPFLRRRFPKVQFDQLHIDLCWALRRLGLTGGLKNIERKMGIPRSPETGGLDGWDAVRLWREWERGSRESLDLLKAYNREDIVNLERLLHYAYDHLRAQTGIP